MAATSRSFAAPTALRRRTSMARFRAAVVSHAPGRPGTPSDGHRCRAIANASCAHSSARSQSPVVRISVATTLPHSSRNAASTAALTSVLINGTSTSHDEREDRHRTAHHHGNRPYCLQPAATTTLPFPRAHPRMSCMPITRDEVAHLARLSRIALTDAELDHLAPQLDQIITAVAQVQEVTAEGIPPTSHATGLTNVYRDDEPRPCLTPEQALDQAPAVEQQRFKVPRILGED